MNQTDARAKTYITEILKKDKTLNEREVKAAVRRGLKLGRMPLGAGVIRKVRRSLGIDRPRALSYARSVLAKNPTLEAKKIIEDVGERFGISLGAPDVTRLRPAGAQRKRRSGLRVEPQPTRKSERSRAKVEVRPTRDRTRSSGAISVRFGAAGAPDNVARFFRTLAK